METKEIDSLEVHKIIFDTYKERKFYSEHIKENGYICFFAPADYAEFVLLIKEESRYLPNEKRATMDDTIPFVVEYARGFTEGYNDFEKIVDNSIYKEDKDKTERIWSIACSQNFGSICSAYDIGDNYILDKKFYLSMALMFRQGKEAGTYYKALEAINGNPSKFKELVGNQEITQKQSNIEKPVFDKRTIQKYCSYNRHDGEYMIKYLDELNTTFHFDDPKTKKQIFGAICLILFEKEEKNTRIFKEVRDFTHLAILLSQYWNFQMPTDIRKNKYRKKADELMQKHYILERQLL